MELHLAEGLPWLGLAVVIFIAYIYVRSRRTRK
jgi:cytochrome oxidase assembly protein ShyY1